MSKESAQGIARRQRRGAVGDWLLGTFVFALVVFMLAGVAFTGGLAAANERADKPAVATPAQVVEQHTALYCGDVPPPSPIEGELPTC